MGKVNCESRLTKMSGCAPSSDGSVSSCLEYVSTYLNLVRLSALSCMRRALILACKSAFSCTLRCSLSSREHGEADLLLPFCEGTPFFAGRKRKSLASGLSSDLRCDGETGRCYFAQLRFLKIHFGTGGNLGIFGLTTCTLFSSVVSPSIVIVGSPSCVDS